MHKSPGATIGEVGRLHVVTAGTEGGPAETSATRKITDGKNVGDGARLVGREPWRDVGCTM